MAIASQTGNEIKIKKSLDDWYLPEKKDYELFAAKYPMNGELLQQGDKIDAMDKWCNAMEIKTTPTIFITDINSPMLTALRIYNIFFRNSTLKEKPCGTIHCCNIVAEQPKPLMLKAKAQTIY